MAKTKEITIGEQKFTLQSVSPSWYYDFNDECGNTGSGKRKSAKYMDGMFKNCVVAPAEVKAKGMEFFDDNEDRKADLRHRAVSSQLNWTLPTLPTKPKSTRAFGAWCGLAMA